MIRLLKIEWLKLRHFKAFWILLIGFALVTILVGSSGNWILNFLKSKGAEYNGISPSIIPLYDFPDVWQNIAYVLGYFKIVLAFIVVISISNEFNHRIVRQNIIDGMSKKEWMLSKLLTMGMLSFLATILLFLVGLINGFFSAHPDSFGSIFSGMDILAAYFLEIFTYLCFATLITLLIRKPGIVIVGLFLYTMMFEPLFTIILMEGPEEFKRLTEWHASLAQFFPVRALMNLIHPPYPKYVFYEVQDYISLKELSIVLGWLSIYITAIYWILRRKDL